MEWLKLEHKKPVKKSMPTVNEDILMGITCWPVLIMGMLGWEVYRRIKKW